MRQSTALVLVALLGLVLGLGCDTKEGSPSPSASSGARRWYEGGTLHKKTMKEWRSASYADRLATTADFVTYAADKQGTAYSSIDELKPRAEALERQISAAGQGGYADTRMVSEVAAACLVLMDHMDQR